MTHAETVAATPHVEPPFFLVGARRSGTTLLSRILDSHPRLAVYHESFLYSIFKAELPWYGSLDEDSHLHRLIQDVREVLGTQIDDVPSLDRIRAVLQRRTLGGVLAALLHLHASAQGKRRGGDKTPEHHHFIGDILDTGISAQVAFIMRDPRDTVLSIRRTFATSVEGAAHVWLNAFMSFRRWRDHVHLVRYETLVREPEPAIEALCEFLGEPYDPVMLEFFHHVPEAFRNRLGGEKLGGPIDPGSIGNFRKMTSSEIGAIERICGPGMEEMGYERVHETGPAGPVVEAARPRQSRTRWVIDRLKYYGFKRARWVRGWARWKVMLRVRLLYLARLGPLRKG